MPGKGNGKGHGMGHMGNRSDEMRDDRGGATGQIDEAGHGRSESSPGHLKREAGAQSARDFAPGRTGKADRGTAVPEAEPDEMAED
jgi:hypothetical protein